MKELGPFERWMVKSNLRRFRAEGGDRRNIAAQIRANGYPQIAEAFEQAAAVTATDIVEELLLEVGGERGAKYVATLLSRLAEAGYSVSN